MTDTGNDLTGALPEVDAVVTDPPYCIVNQFGESMHDVGKRVRSASGNQPAAKVGLAIRV